MARLQSSLVMALCLALYLLGGASCVNGQVEPGPGTQQQLEQQLKQAIAYDQQRDFAHALPLLRDLKVHLPRNYAVNLLLGRDLLGDGQPQQALAPLGLACALQPGEGVAEVFLAQAASAVNDFALAAKAFETGVERSHDAAPYLESWAAFCMDRFRTVEVKLRETAIGEATAFRVEAALHPEASSLRRTLLEQSAAASPNQSGLWGELGLAQLEAGNVAAAQTSLNQAARREPDGLATLALDALLSLAEKRWPQAEARLVALGRRSPAEFARAVTLWRHVLQSQFPAGASAWACLRQEAVPCPAIKAAQADEAVSRDPHQLYQAERWEALAALPSASGAQQLLWRGVARAHVADCRRAIPDLEGAMAADALSAGLWLDICYASEGEQAAARLRQAGDARAYHQLRGDLLLRLHGDAAGARDEYLAAATVSPRDAHLKARLAEADRQLGHVEQSKLEGKAALAIDPHEASALETLALSAINEREYAAGLDFLQQLQAIEPGEPLTQVQAGVCLAQLGRAQEAVDALSPALANGYADPKGAYHAQLARMLRKLGRTADAERAEAEAERLANASLSREQDNDDHKK